MVDEEEEEEEMTEEREHRETMVCISSDLEMFEVCSGREGDLPKPAVVLLQLRPAPFAAGALPLCLRRALPPALVVPSQPPAAAPLCLVEFRQLMEPTKTLLQMVNQNSIA